MSDKDKSSDGTREPIMLINAMSKRDDLYVLVDDYPVLLPKVPSPLLVSRTKANETQEFRINDSVIDLTVASEAEPSFILSSPPVIDGVWYVVDPITKVEFPHRDDFVIPHSFALWITEAEWKDGFGKDDYSQPKKKGKGKKGSKKRGKKGGKKRAKEGRGMPELSHAMRYPLVSIAIGPVATASPDTTELSLED